MTVRAELLWQTPSLQFVFTESRRQGDAAFSQKVHQAAHLARTKQEEAKTGQGILTDRGNVRDDRPGSSGGQSRDKAAASVGIGSGRQYSRTKKM